MATPSEVQLLLVRCSRTEWDEAGRLGGDCDLPACKAWGEELTAALRGHDLSTITAVLTGPDEASVQTAKHLSALLDKKVRTIDNLREIDLGLWEGQRFDELEDRFPNAFKQWKDDPSSVVPPEAEPLAEAEGRLLVALAKALEKLNGKGRHVAVVLRPIAFHIVASHLQGQEPTAGWDAAASGPLLLGLKVRPDAIAPAKAL